METPALERDETLPVPLDEIPGLKETLAAERAKITRLRELSFLDVPLLLCEVEVEQLKPKHWQLLSIAGNAFAVGGVIGLVDVVQFLWIVSAGFCVDEAKSAKFAEEHAFEQAELSALVAEIDEYIEDAWMDRRPGTAGVSSMPSVCVTAAIYHDLESAYPHLTVEKIRDMPFGQIFQRIRLIDEDACRAAGVAPPPSFSRLDKLRRELTEAFRAQNG